MRISGINFHVHINPHHATIPMAPDTHLLRTAYAPVTKKYAPKTPMVAPLRTLTHQKFFSSCRPRVNGSRPGSWNLKVLWSLVLGIWSAVACRQPHGIRNTQPTHPSLHQLAAPKSDAGGFNNPLFHYSITPFPVGWRLTLHICSCFLSSKCLSSSALKPDLRNILQMLE